MIYDNGESLFSPEKEDWVKRVSLLAVFWMSQYLHERIFLMLFILLEGKIFILLTCVVSGLNMIAGKSEIANSYLMDTRNNEPQILASVS